MKIGVIGSGSWGTALALLLDKNGHNVFLWSFEEEQINELKQNHENKRFLPGIMLPSSLVDNASPDLEKVAKDADAIVMVVPTFATKKVAKDIKPFVKNDAIIICASKGFDRESFASMSEIMEEVFGKNQPIAVLSGPSHAEEVGKFLPTTVVSAAKDEEIAKKVQNIFNNSEFFRVYTNNDVMGVEIAGALKNTIAIACGIADGLGLGDNAQAALMTRGMWEIARLGKKMGGEDSTFFGLAGIGDLAVTCGSRHSRNRRLGRLLGQGVEIKEAIASLGMVAEGVGTAIVAHSLAEKYNVEMPISEAVYQVVTNISSAKNEFYTLMNRPIKNELH